MELADRTSYRALAFVAALVDQGYYPTQDELAVYLMDPTPRQAPSALTRMQSSLQLAMRAALQGGQPEPHYEWLLRVGWLNHVDEERIGITLLGRALLRALNQQELESDVALEVTLEASDPLAYAKVIGRIAKHEEGLVIDPYFKVEQLLHLVQQTSIQRILIGEQLPSHDRASLATAVETLRLERPFEIRIAGRDKMHDRYVISRTGPIETIGISLSGVGKKLTVMNTLNPPAADVIRDTYEEIWLEAEVLVTAGSGEAVTFGEDVGDQG